MYSYFKMKKIYEIFFNKLDNSFSNLKFDENSKTTNSCSFSEKIIIINKKKYRIKLWDLLSQKKILE